MANTFPIVTEVTLSELDALVAANALEEGLQYKVTDKSWLLIATSNHTLNSIENIKIIVGDYYVTQPFLKYIPDYISANSLCLDSGEIITDISILSNNPFLFDQVSGYSIVKLYIDGQSRMDSITLEKIGTYVFNQEIGFRENAVNIINIQQTQFLDIYISGVGNGSRTRIYAIYDKMPF